MVTGQHCHLLTSVSLCLPLSVQVEKRLELVKQVSHSTHKKLTACLQGQQGAEADKRSVSTLCRAQAAQNLRHRHPGWHPQDSQSLKLLMSPHVN